MAALENRGYKATAPRKAIAKHLEQKHETFTAEALSEELPSVGRATVYRTVKLLLEAGLVCKVPMIDGARVYSLARVGHHHHHSVCVQCGAVGEFKAAIIDRSLRAIAADIPGQVVKHRIELYVTCNDCRADRG
ncbi:MAG: Fur family transcriptional regulator [Dehalococcoidia bacterium]|nr:Fur family transcriptional regulator [Dehalococcoidia bacterium]